MSGISSSYLDTRLSVFSKRLIRFPRLLALIDFDLERILTTVNTITGHSYELDQSDENQFENQLVNHALEDFKVLIRPFSGGERRLFYFAMRWFELVNLKVLIRGKFSGTDSLEIQKRLINLGSFADLPNKKLLETDDPYEMLRMLESTAYASIVRHARRVFEEQGNDLFLLDATIDRGFFIDLHQRTRFLNDYDAEHLQHVMGAMMDRFNLLWLLRFRFSYGLSPAKSFYLLTSVGSRLNSVELMRLAKLDSLEAVIAALPETYQTRLAHAETISDIEIVMDYYSLAIAKDTLCSDASLVSRIFSYILLREAEVRFLQALIKGKQLGFDDALIKLAVGAVN